MRLNFMNSEISEGLEDCSGVGETESRRSDLHAEVFSYLC